MSVIVLAACLVLGAVVPAAAQEAGASPGADSPGAASPGAVSSPGVVSSPAVPAEEEVCTALTVEELGGTFDVAFDEGSGFEGYCEWRTGDGSVSVSIILEAGPLAELRSQAPGGEDQEIAGFPGYVVEMDLGTGTRAGAVAVETDGLADAIYIETTDPDVDLIVTALETMRQAAPRLAGMEYTAPADFETSQPLACALFEPAEIESALGVAVNEVDYSNASCAWEGDEVDGGLASVSVSYDASDLSEIRMFFPDGEDLSVGGRPGYLYTFDVEGGSSASLAVDLGPETATLSVLSPDAGFDARAMAVALLETALTRGLVVGPEPSAGPGACSLLGADQVADALGIEGPLEVVDLGDACSYFLENEEVGLDIWLTLEDPEELAFSAEALGAVEVEGIGDAAWWAEELATLYAVAGDEAFSVSVTGGEELTGVSTDELAQKLMELLVAPS